MYYSGISEKTIKALNYSKDDILTNIPFEMSVHKTNDEMIDCIVEQFINDYENLKKKDKEKILFIMPVGPVGQYRKIAEYFNKKGDNLNDLILIFMDEYLDLSNDYISDSHPLSFRKHVQEEFIQILDSKLMNTEENIIFPNPKNLSHIGKIIGQYGLDLCYAGVGITGHLAFNDPVADFVDIKAFADLPTRIVWLSERTRVINAVTATKGNIEQIPHMAVTVGMKEILSANQIRVWMNREWQCAAIRRMAFGEITPAFPASLLQQHGNVSLNIVKHVLNQPQPGLR